MFLHEIYYSDNSLCPRSSFAQDISCDEISSILSVSLSKQPPSPSDELRDRAFFISPALSLKNSDSREISAAISSSSFPAPLRRVILLLLSIGFLHYCKIGSSAPSSSKSERLCLSSEICARKPSSTVSAYSVSSLRKALSFSELSPRFSHALPPSSVKAL